QEKRKIINYFLITQGLEIKEVTEFYNYLLLPPYGVIPFREKIFHDKIYQDKPIGKRLALWGNSISNIEPLSSVSNLTHLLLEDNNISNVEPLSSLTNLKYISLWRNPLKVYQVEEL